MDSDFDPDRLRLVASLTTGPPMPRPCRNLYSGRGNFIKGPLYLSWIGAAARLPGSALRVALLVAYRSGMARVSEVLIPGTDLPIFGLTRFSFGRGIKVLERAGLIVATRAAGRKPRIRMLELRDLGTHRTAGGEDS